MKIIEYLHLVNWHYIEKKTLPINRGVNFFTGKNGSGKSTIIDAIQLLVIGDTRGGYFNKAANEKSKRKLSEYLMGMNNVEDSGKKYFVRNNDFSSYVVMQVHDTEKNKRFCLGICFDVSVSTENIVNKLWFYQDRTLPEDGFVKNGRVQTTSEFKRNYIKTPDMIFESDKEYRAFCNTPKIMGKFGREFYDTFKKAVAFKSPDNIREFFEEFVCENKEIDIENMKSNIQIYKKMENQIIDMEAQKKILDEINDIYIKYNNNSNRITMYDYGIDKIERYNLEKNLEKYNSEIIELTRRITSLSDEETVLVNELKDLSEKEKVKHSSLAQAKENTRIDHLNDEIKRINNDINRLTNEKERILHRINSLLKWDKIIENIDDYNIEYDVKELLKIKDSFSDFKNLNFNKEKLNHINNILIKLKGIIEEKYSDLSYQVKEIQEKRKIKASELKELKDGYKGYNQSLINFKNTLESELFKLYKKEISVDILADLIEIKSPEWADAIEGYMNSTKLNIIIEPLYYNDALRIYNNLDKSKYYGFGIVDIEKILELDIKVKNNSLAEEIITLNPYARTYVEYVLQNVIKCENIENIRNNAISITKDCFLYKGYIASRINEKNYTQNRCIGKRAIELRIESLNKEIKELDNKEESINEIYYKLAIYKDLKTCDEFEIDELEAMKAEIAELPGLRERKDQLVKELEEVDLTLVLRLNDELEAISAKKEEKLNLIKTNYADKQEAEKKKEENTGKIPGIEDKISNIKTSMLKKYDNEFMDSELCLEITKEVLDNENRLIKLRDEYQENKKELEYRNESVFNIIIEKRKQLLLKFHIDKGITSKSNADYDKYLKELSSNNLPKYKQQIIVQQEKAYEQFRQEFLCELSDAIRETKSHVKTINQSLDKIRFGNDKYYYRVKPSKQYEEFYNMLTDDDLIKNPISLYIHSSNYKHVIDDLFEKIVEKGETIEEKGRVQKNIEIYTNYKTYLDFDMICESEDGKKASVTKAFELNSGGETQNPFYITILSAFMQVYQMHNKAKEDTMRLVVFDEAFNKMDEDRIASSIDLLYKMGLQAIIVAPSEKIGLIGPSVDEIVHLEARNKERIIVTEFTKRSDIMDFVNASVI